MRVPVSIFSALAQRFWAESAASPDRWSGRRQCRDVTPPVGLCVL